MKVKKLVFLALLVSSAIVLNFIEFLIPIPIPIPGVRLGLANLITVFCLYKMEIKDTVLVLSLRIILASFLFGTPISLLYSFTGSFFSLSCMILFKRFHFNLILVSIIGGIMHNVGQIILASLILENFNLFISYLPYLMLLGLITGFAIGICIQIFFDHFTSIDKFMKGID